MKVSVVIPTYNERENLPILIDRLFKALNSFDFEVIVVDDNSPDGTWMVAESLTLKYCGKIRVLRRYGKLGLASAIIDGFKLSQGDVIVVMDADLQHPPEVLEDLIKPIESSDADLVIASRYVKDGGVEGWSFWRILVSRIATLISHIVLPETRGIKDPMSGFFILRKNIVNGLAFNPKGYKILLEILVKARLLRVVEVPYVFKARRFGSSKLNFNEYVNFLVHIFRLSNYRPLKFALVGLSGILVNLGLLELLVRFSLNIYLASACSIETSIVSNYLLNTLWTFRSRLRSGFIKSLVKYHFAVALGALINWIVFSILVFLGFHYIASQLIGILIGFLANYALSEYYVWI